MLKRLSAALLVFLFSFLPVLVVPQGAAALFTVSACKDFGFIQNSDDLALVNDWKPIQVNAKIDITQLPLNEGYAIAFYDRKKFDRIPEIPLTPWQKPDSNGNLTFNIDLSKDDNPQLYNYDHLYGYIYMESEAGGIGPLFRDPSCYLGRVTVDIGSDLVRCDSIEVSQVRNGKTCYANSKGCFQSDTQFKVKIKGLKYPDGTIYQNAVQVKVGQFASLEIAPAPPLPPIPIKYPDQNGDLEWNFFGSILNTTGSYDVIVERGGFIAGTRNFDCTGVIRFSLACQDTQDPNSCDETPNNISPGTIGESTPFLLCDQINDSNLKQQCLACADSSQDAGVWTAVGCIKREPTSIAQSLIKIGLGTGGGISLLMILGAGFMLSSSQGDPKKTNEAKEMITAALTGLLFIIFSVTILQFIGVKVLQIPGFGG